MKTSLLGLSFAALWVISPQWVWAEGSKQLTPNTNNVALTDPTNTRSGYLSHDDNLLNGINVSLGFLKPASWTGPTGEAFSADYRMYIHMEPGETLHYGVHRIPIDPAATGVAQSDLVITLRYGAGAGQIVKQDVLARDPNSVGQSTLLQQQGVINTGAEAFAGPQPAAGGYNALVYTNNTGAAQDFYVEFTQVGEENMTDSNKRSAYDFWDFTVRANGVEKPGRLYSKHWGFFAGNSGGTNNFQNRLSSTFKLYPMVESRQAPGQYYVKEVELAGMRPLSFYFVANEFGSTTAVGTTIEARRRSQTTRTSYTQYPAFVNNPDPAVWPSAPTPTVSVTPRPYCRNGVTEVAFTTQSAETGQFDILIDIDRDNVRDADEPLLRQTLQAGVPNTVIWNGRRKAAGDVDGNSPTGTQVAAGTTIRFDFTSFGAPVNFPVYDAEGNPDGFRVRNIRPANGNNFDLLYWDDTNLTAFPTAIRTAQLSGVSSATGAHAWGTTNDEGNNYTVNTWTYGFSVFVGDTEFTYSSACDNDGDGVADATDIDDDNDGILDVVEAMSTSGTSASSIDPSSFADGSSPILYLDGAYVHPVLGAFRDLNNDGVNDIFDTDRDGIPNHFDLDSDNDGLSDAFEAGTTALVWTSNNGNNRSAYSEAQGRFVNTLGSIANAVGANGLPNAVELRTSNNTEVDNVRYTLTDNDSDNFTASNATVTNYNFLDVDSDNDGISDEIEALTTSTYNLRKAAIDFNIDTDGDGIRDAYDGNNGGNVINTRNNNPDGDAIADMFDNDSDGDNATRVNLPIYQQTADWTEGFDTDRDGRAGDEIVALARLFAVNNPSKASYYSVVVPGSGTVNSPFLQDSDNDDVPNFLDINSTYFHDDNFNGLVDIYDPAYGGMPSTAPKRTVAQTDVDFRSADILTPLPVELIEFKAQANGLDGLLTWATAQEKNNAGFELERSSDGVNFEKVGNVAGVGNSNRRNDYRFVDKGAGKVAGLRYYRLRQVDADGKSAYSNIQAVMFSGSKTSLVVVYPNPTAADAKLDLTSLPQGTYSVEILGAEGRHVASLEGKGGELLPLQTSRFAKGSYIVRVSGNGQAHVLKLVKM
ncbi:T9SS type A sorting domain-containing protein [Hymenobacter latericus]|uniref:T9SS type A sorting domain-containing protein n=1 Tax=Hymenobacter sp. YIM 151858-1 TaxID=2987688 RepID=UPI002226C58F|nr:T9SS type A sorting domain-containing protein [Hymenobacter sp. YIM 151858-1]UYZ60044.1 T9SS type A sorting domain-containing protein [Hymenobacter sp. YIM 151858-1]